MIRFYFLETMLCKSFFILTLTIKYIYSYFITCVLILKKTNTKPTLRNTIKYISQRCNNHTTFYEKKSLVKTMQQLKIVFPFCLIKKLSGLGCLLVFPTLYNHRLIFYCTFLPFLILKQTQKYSSIKNGKRF